MNSPDDPPKLRMAEPDSPEQIARRHERDKPSAD